MNTVQCKLCPKQCLIKPGSRGDCKIRYNQNGKLILLTYGRPCSIHMDPIEKKPLFHFNPGKKILSIGTAGCNLHCKNCQNWQISQSKPEDVTSYSMQPQDVVSLTRRNNSNMIAYTYTEPLAYYEYTLDTSIIAKSYGLENVLVTAGYCNEKPLRKIYRYIDAANIDLKFFNDKMYQKITTGRLKPVLNALLIAKEMDVWLEITNLIIPTLNDNLKEIERMVVWIKDNLGAETPLHFSRFQPHYLMENIPTTQYEILKKAHSIARDVGLKYVYIGNVYGTEEENTYCPNCKNPLIERAGYKIIEYKIKDNKCPNCSETIAGRWNKNA